MGCRALKTVNIRRAEEYFHIHLCCIQSDQIFCTALCTSSPRSFVVCLLIVFLHTYFLEGRLQVECLGVGLLAIILFVPLTAAALAACDFSTEETVI